MLIHQARFERELGVADLAAMAGVSHGTISKLEHGRAGVTVATAERIFAAMGLRLHVEAVPDWADVGGAVEQAAKQTLAERMATWPADVPFFIRRFSDYPYLVDGLTSAAFQGAPVKIRQFEIAIRGDDETLERLANELWRLNATRGDGWEAPDPRVDGSDRYSSPCGDLRIRLIDDYQPMLWAEIDPLPENRFPWFRSPAMTRARVALVPLEEIRVTDPYARAVLQRMTLPR